MSLYQPNPDFVVPCFWDFSYRFNSLYRHWQFSKDSTTAYTKSVSETPDRILKNYNAKKEQYIKEKETGIKHDKKTSMLYESDWSEELLLVHYENEHSDIEYFPEFLKASTLSMALSTFENLLGDLSEDIARELKVEIELPEKGGYINKYITWFTRGCGIEIKLSKENNRKLNAIRNIRNRFIHRISRDIPKDIRDTISKMVNQTENEDLISNDFIEHSLKEISSLASKLETAYIKFLNQKKKNDLLDKLGIPEDLR
jgi:hypothetical protein